MDVEWIDQAEALVAEVTHASHGVGYELGWAVAQAKQVVAIYEQHAAPPDFADDPRQSGHHQSRIHRHPRLGGTAHCPRAADRPRMNDPALHAVDPDTGRRRYLSNAGRIDITGIDLVWLLQDAYQESVPAGRGYLHFPPGPAPGIGRPGEVVNSGRPDSQFALSVDYLLGPIAEAPSNPRRRPPGDPGPVARPFRPAAFQDPGQAGVRAEGDPE